MYVDNGELLLSKLYIKDIPIKYYNKEKILSCGKISFLSIFKVKLLHMNNIIISKHIHVEVM